jgi:hypothetical protein
MSAALGAISTNRSRSNSVQIFAPRARSLYTITLESLGKTDMVKLLRRAYDAPSFCRWGYPPRKDGLTAAVIAALALTACATHPAKTLEVHAIRLNPALCAKVQPEPRLPDAAGLPAAVTPAEKEALRAFLTWTADILDWSRSGWARAEKVVASEACG